MKFRSLLFGGAVVAMFSIAAVGCNENPLVSGPAAVTSLKASSLSATSVGLTWTPGSTGGTFNVSWKGDIQGDTGSVRGVTATTATASPLTAGQSYTFTVKAVASDGTESSPVTVKWAPANRYSKDQANSSVTIRMYEFDSQKGSALALDNFAPFNGPRNVSAKSTLPLAERNLVQMVILVNDANSTFGIGPAYAFSAFKAVNDFYKNLYIGDSTYVASSLDTWYDSKPIDQRIIADSGNVFAYTGIPNAPGGTTGQGFYVRTGASSADYHYARIFINNVGGKLLQGTAPDRYVELTISYQSTANLPYAKMAGAGRQAAPGGVAAHRGF